ncbi:hypothetical protein HHI36_001421 [Cryptolaemus montrouzieri]|uniref:CCHC-type domain-containing protein n=1 Tax=Cryptolaemus montrouzieri TaxID=559131 RepID=A0ABD2P7M9_9CUCU
MDYEMKPNHLLIGELNYELRIRGVTSERDQDVKRKMLGRLLDKERRGQVQNLLDPSYVFANERDDIEYALLSIRQLINEFEGTTSDSVYKRVKSRLAHITSRVQRMPIDAEVNDHEQRDFKSESYATCIELDAELHERVLPSVAAVLPDPSQASTSTQQPILNVLNSQLSHSFRSVPISSKRLENNDFLELDASSRKNSKQSGALLEPELYGIYDSKTSISNKSSHGKQNPFDRPTPSVSAVESGSTKPITCWNCSKSGHRYSSCKEKRTGKFCYRCGCKDVTWYTCKKCSGNGNRR